MGRLKAELQLGILHAFFFKNDAKNGPKKRVNSTHYA